MAVQKGVKTEASVFALLAPSNTTLGKSPHQAAFQHSPGLKGLKVTGEY